MLARLGRAHPFQTPEARRFAILFAVVYLAQGMWYLPNQTITIVLKERGLSAGDVASLLRHHHDPVAHQAGVRPRVGLRAPLRPPAEELLPRHVHAGRALRGRARPSPGASVLADGRARHRDGLRAGLHRRAHRRADGGDGQAARAHRRVPGRAVGGDLHRLRAGRRDRRRVRRGPRPPRPPSSWPRRSRWCPS